MPSRIDAVHAAPEALLVRIQEQLPDKWSVQQLVQLAEKIVIEDQALLGQDNEIIGLAVHIATGQFQPAPRDPRPGVRRLCGVLMVLSFIGFTLPYSAGVYKAVVTALHLAIDVLSDFELSTEFCVLVAKRADQTGAYSIAVLALGDLGIALARAELFEESLPVLAEAVSRAVRAEDLNSAARYNSELGRSEFMLGNLRNAGQTWSIALQQARQAGDRDLEGQISANLTTLTKLAQ